MSNVEISRWSHKVKLVNGYGPSECSVVAAVNSSITSTSKAGNIGLAVGGLCWVVNPNNHHQLAPLGCIGELLIEGPTLACGYLNMEHATAESFIVNPRWASSSGNQRRLYKSGDLVSYNEDGTLTYVGRKDCQVKLRGQRMELGEIEHAMQVASTIQAQYVAETFVPAGQTDRQKLVAFVCFDDDNDLAPRLLMSATLRRSLIDAQKELVQSLPKYMIPSYYVPLSRLPKVLSGKLDRRELRKIAANLTCEELSTYSLLDVEKRAPATEMEKRLQKLWAEEFKS